MEQLPRAPGGGGQFYEAGRHEQRPPEQRNGRFTDDQLIYHHITEALREDRPIDHATARCIAAQLHGGQASPLYALASTGAIVEGAQAELDAWREDNETGVDVEPWLDALNEYLQARGDPGPIEDWPELWPAPPAVVEPSAADIVPSPDDEAAERQALMERITAAGVTTLGQVATVGVAVTPADAVRDPRLEPLPAPDIEPDPFSWADAAEWNRAEVALNEYEERHYPPEQLDELFHEPPDEAIGSVDDLGWYGLVKHEDRPGGLILIKDEQGFRRVREADTDETLNAQWAAIQREYETFYEQRDAYELATERPSSTPSGHHPQIWVASLSDYNRGDLYGVWLDATIDPDELQNAIAFMMRNSPSRDAEEWAVFDSDDFGGYQVSEYASLKTVSRIAQGVAEHGPAFAEWVAIVGDDSEELLTDDAFQDHYEGEWDSLEHYVEYILDEAGFTAELERALQGLPEDLRRYVHVDVEGIAEEWTQGLHVVDRGDGTVWLFDGRT